MSGDSGVRMASSPLIRPSRQLWLARTITQCDCCMTCRCGWWALDLYALPEGRKGMRVRDMGVRDSFMYTHLERELGPGFLISFSRETSVFLKIYLLLFYAYVYFSSMDICAPCACLTPAETSGGCWIPRKWVTNGSKSPYGC